MTITFSYPYKREIYINTRLITNMLMKNFYRNSRKELKKVLKNNKQISHYEWDEYAYKNGFFSSISIMAHEDTEKWEDLKERFGHYNW